MSISLLSKNCTVLAATIALVACSGGGGSSGGAGGAGAGASSVPSQIITGKLTGPGGAVAKFKLMDIFVPNAWAALPSAPVPNAKVKIFSVDSKGRATGIELGSTTSLPDGSFAIAIPAYISLSDVSSVLVANGQ